MHSQETTAFSEELRDIPKLPSPSLHENRSMETNVRPEEQGWLKYSKGNCNGIMQKLAHSIVLWSCSCTSNELIPTNLRKESVVCYLRSRKDIASSSLLPVSEYEVKDFCTFLDEFHVAERFVDFSYEL